MPRKLLPFAAVLLLVAAACAEPPTPTVDVGSGVRFLPAVADSLNDAGRHPAVVVNEEGRPVVAYFGFEEIPERDEVVQTRPVGSPSIPGVFLATVSEEGYWSRGAIAIADEIANVDVAFNPAIEPTVADLTPENVTGLALVADAQTYHAVWGSGSGTFYATGSLDPAASTQATASLVSNAPAFGHSIALVDGEPWIAFVSNNSSAATVGVATPDGDGWQIDSVGPTTGCELCRTAIAATSGGPAVAYSDGGNGVSVAAADGENGWVSFEVLPDGGQGLSAAAAGGDLALSFYDGGRVTVATGPPTGPFSTALVAEVADGSEAAPGAGTSLTVAGDGSFAVAWVDADDGVSLATGDTGAPEPVDTAGSASDGASPSVAFTEDGSVVYVAWYATDQQDLLVGVYGDLGEVPFAAPSPTPTGTASVAPPPTTECTPVEGGTVAVVAEGISFTDGSCIEAAVGEPFTIAFDNQDTDVEHNVQIFTGPDPSGDLLVETDTVVGPAQIDYDVPALDAGEYAYNCVIHPTAMIGAVQVGGGGAGGATGPTGATGATGGGGGPSTTTVTASGIAFDTSTIGLSAGEPSTITFVNEDAQTQHNIAIYPSADNLADFLFRGDLITGPDEIDYAIDPFEAGEYYFQCDIHPTMNGTVTVS